MIKSDDKREDPVSQAFIMQFLYLSEDILCSPINLFLSLPIWKREND